MSFGARIGVSALVRIGAAIGTDPYGGAATLQSIAVTPDVTMIGTTATQQMTATGTYSDTTTQDLTAQVTWSSATGATATIDSAGLATAVAGGTTVITAQLGLISGTTTLCVAPKDATSSIFCPLSQNDWKAVFRRASKLVGYTIAEKTVNQSWGLQDASGNPAATIGTALTAYGTLTYQQSITGWARKAIRSDLSTTEGIGHPAAGAGPNAGTNSVLWFCYADITSVTGATRPLMCGSNSATNRVRMLFVQTTGLLRVDCASVNADGATNHLTGGVRPLVLAYDRTSSLVAGFSDVEAVNGTYSAAVTDQGGKGYPSSAAIAGCGADYLLGAAFEGAHAEWTDGSGGTAASRLAANVKAVYQAMGWTVSGY